MLMSPFSLHCFFFFSFFPSFLVWTKAKKKKITGYYNKKNINLTIITKEHLKPFFFVSDVIISKT